MGYMADILNHQYLNEWAHDYAAENVDKFEKDFKDIRNINQHIRDTPNKETNWFGH